MEERFKAWLRLCIRDEDLSKEEIDRVKSKNRDTCRRLFNDFIDFDRFVISDFVFDCVHDVEKEKR